MKERIKKIRKKYCLTQEKFAEKLGLKRNTIATYETGKSEPMESVILSMCREFNINEEWLRTGFGEMLNFETDDYTKISVDIAKHDKKAKQAIIDYWNLSEQDKELFWNFMNRFVNRNGEV